MHNAMVFSLYIEVYIHHYSPYEKTLSPKGSSVLSAIIPRVPLPHPPCPFEYPPRRPDGRGREEGGRRGKDPPHTLCQAWHLSGVSSDRPSRGLEAPQGPGSGCRVLPPPTRAGADETRGSFVWKSLDRVKRADIERAKTRFTPAAPLPGEAGLPHL